MNIFYTSHCPIESANNLCKVHIIKMITESAQIMSTAHRLLDGNIEADAKSMYKATHTWHPDVKWCVDSDAHYKWLYNHFKAMCKLYTAISGGKIHKCDRTLSKALLEAPKTIANRDFTPPPKCMPDHIKSRYSDVTKCYKDYLNEKYKEWLDRNRPMRVEYPHLNKLPDWLEV